MAVYAKHASWTQTVTEAEPVVLEREATRNKAVGIGRCVSVCIYQPTHSGARVEMTTSTLIPNINTDACHEISCLCDLRVEARRIATSSARE